MKIEVSLDWVTQIILKTFLLIFCLSEMGNYSRRGFTKVTKVSSSADKDQYQNNFDEFDQERRNEGNCSRPKRIQNTNA